DEELFVERLVSDLDLAFPELEVLAAELQGGEFLRPLDHHHGPLAVAAVGVGDPYLDRSRSCRELRPPVPETGCLLLVHPAQRHGFPPEAQAPTVVPPHGGPLQTGRPAGFPGSLCEGCRGSSGRPASCGARAGARDNWPASVARESCPASVASESWPSSAPAKESWPGEAPSRRAWISPIDWRAAWRKEGSSQKRSAASCSGCTAAAVPTRPRAAVAASRRSLSSLWRA